MILYVFIIPFESQARRGWSIKGCSVNYGWSMGTQGFFCKSFELTYENGMRSCTIKPFYYGLSLGYHYGDGFQEYKIRGQRMMLPWWYVQRMNGLFVPYVFTELGIQKSAYKNNTSNYYTGAIGVGVVGKYRLFRKLEIKTYLQYGLRSSQSEVNYGSGGFWDVKVGAGLNQFLYRKAKYKKTRH